MSGPRFAFDFGMKQYIEESHVEFWKNSLDIGRKEKVSKHFSFSSLLILIQFWCCELTVWITSENKTKGFMDFVSITYELHRHTIIKKENQN